MSLEKGYYVARSVIIPGSKPDIVEYDGEYFRWFNGTMGTGKIEVLAGPLDLDELIEIYMHKSLKCTCTVRSGSHPSCPAHRSYCPVCNSAPSKD